MQVSSKTCSCSGEKERDGVGGCGISPESAALPPPSSLICLHSQLRCARSPDSQTQSSSPLTTPPPLHHSPTTTAGRVPPPSLAHIKLWRLWAAPNWPAVRVDRAANDLGGDSQTTLSGFCFSTWHWLQAQDTLELVSARGANLALYVPERICIFTLLIQDAGWLKIHRMVIGGVQVRRRSQAIDAVESER